MACRSFRNVEEAGRFQGAVLNLGSAARLASLAKPEPGFGCDSRENAGPSPESRSAQEDSLARKLWFAAKAPGAEYGQPGPHRHMPYEEAPGKGGGSVSWGLVWWICTKQWTQAQKVRSWGVGGVGGLGELGGLGVCQPKFWLTGLFPKHGMNPPQKGFTGH